MAMVSFAFGSAFLLFHGPMPSGSLLPVCVLGAAAGAAVELFSPSEWDTVSVLAVILVFLLLL